MSTKSRVKFEVIGTKIIIPKETIIFDNGYGMKTEWEDKTYSIIIGIGKNWTAELIIEEDSLKALRSGERIHIAEKENEI